MNLMRNIHKATVNTFTLPPHHSTNVYIVGGHADAVLIDPIYAPGNPLDRMLAACNIQSIQFAAVTHPHPDHYGGLDKLIERFGGRVLCHASTGDIFKRSTSDQILHVSGGETVYTADDAIKVLHTPGHSSAHICFYIETQAALFSGDTIVGHGTSIISPPEGNMTDYFNTLNHLATLDIQTIYPAHGPVIDRYAAQRIQWYIAHRKMREERVISALKRGMRSLTDITRQIYREEDYQMHGRDLLPRARRSVLAHLEKLESEGAVVREEQEHEAYYYLT